MGNLSKSKLKLYICDNKLRSCAQFAPRGKCAPECIFIKHRLYDQNTSQVQIYTRVYICTGVYIVHMNEALSYSGPSGSLFLTLKTPITTAADDIF